MKSSPSPSMKRSFARNGSIRRQSPALVPDVKNRQVGQAPQLDASHPRERPGLGVRHILVTIRSHHLPSSRSARL